MKKLSDLVEQAKAGDLSNQELFTADILDWALKDDWHSMEHPMFSLSKTPDLKERHYEHNGSSIIITPSGKGLATIWDKDILIFCISQLIAAMNQDRQVSKTIRLKAAHLLKTTKRHTGGTPSQLLRDAFMRLRGTTITTSIATNGRRIRKGFGLIDNWEIVERTPNGEMLAIEITLSQWLYNAIMGHEVLTLSPDYFNLTGALERRLYELARKHCGRQASWVVSLDLLYKKSGSTATLREFRRQVKEVAAKNNLPDYKLTYDRPTDQVTFTFVGISPTP